MKNETEVWINGRWMNVDDVRISPFDLGLSVGMGVFETMAAYDGAVFEWKLHERRMLEGMKVLGVNRNYLLPREEMEVVMKELLLKNSLTSGRARVRVSLSAGVNPLNGGSEKGNLMVTAVEADGVGAMAKLCKSPFPSMKGDPLQGVKSSSFGVNVLVYRSALKAGCDEAFRVTHDGEVSECAMANLFLVSKGVVLTPRLESGCLPGVTRLLVMDLCRQLGMTVNECRVEVGDVNFADEVFITSSLREVQPAFLNDAQKINDRPVTDQLIMAYRTLLSA